MIRHRRGPLGAPECRILYAQRGGAPQSMSLRGPWLNEVCDVSTLTNGPPDPADLVTGRRGESPHRKDPRLRLIPPSLSGGRERFLPAPRAPPQPLPRTKTQQNPNPQTRPQNHPPPPTAPPAPP